jgi:hypothetical protein
VVNLQHQEVNAAIDNAAIHWVVSFEGGAVELTNQVGFVFGSVVVGLFVVGFHVLVHFLYSGYGLAVIAWKHKATIKMGKQTSDRSKQQNPRWIGAGCLLVCWVVIGL